MKIEKSSVTVYFVAMRALESNSNRFLFQATRVGNFIRVRRALSLHRFPKRGDSLFSRSTRPRQFATERERGSRVEGITGIGGRQVCKIRLYSEVSALESSYEVLQNPRAHTDGKPVAYSPFAAQFLHNCLSQSLK